MPSAPPPLIFVDRLDAARQLAAQRQPYREKQPLVCAARGASREALEKVRFLADVMVSLQAPHDLRL